MPRSWPQRGVLRPAPGGTRGRRRPVSRAELAAAYEGFALTTDKTGSSREALAAYGRALAIRESLARAEPTAGEPPAHRGNVPPEDRQPAVQHWVQRRGAANAGPVPGAGRAPGQLWTRPTARRRRESSARSETTSGRRAGCPRRRGRFARSATLYRRLVDEQPNVADLSDGLASCYLKLSRLLTQEGRPDEALRWLAQSLAAYERLSAEHPEVDSYRDAQDEALLYTGVNNRIAGRPAEALQWFERSLAMTERLAVDRPGVVRYREPGSG